MMNKKHEEGKRHREICQGVLPKKGSLTDQKDAKLVVISSILVDLSDKSQP